MSPVTREQAKNSSEDPTPWDRSAPGAEGELPIILGYTLGEVLGRGATGVVFQAYSLARKGPVALKVFYPGHGKETIGRFQRAVKAADQLDHPNLVRVHESGVSQGRLYMSLDLIDGESVQARLERQGPSSLEEALTVALKLTSVLEHAHAQRILHRDINPSNVLLSRNGEPYLSDFGLAKAWGGNQLTLTRTGEFLGTVAYTSPEQARGERDLDQRTDLYSLGATLYALLTGRPPYTAESVAGQLVALLCRRPDPPSKHREGLDEDLSAVCLQLLEKDRDRRYGSATELRLDLERYQRGEPTEARRRFAEDWRQQMLRADTEQEATLRCRRAAESGDREAMSLLFHRLVEGVGCSPDPLEGIVWAEKAVKLGCSKSMTALGTVYELGRGVPCDPDQAQNWYRRAIEAGDTLALERLKALQHELEGGSPAERGGQTQLLLTAWSDFAFETEPAASLGPDPHDREFSLSSLGMQHFLLSDELVTPLPLPDPGSFPIGRDVEAYVTIHSELVSRRHAELFWRDGVLMVQDLGSTNGTILNGHRLRRPCPALSGDVLTVGSAELLVRAWAPQEVTTEEIDLSSTTRNFRVRELREGSE